MLIFKSLYCNRERNVCQRGLSERDMGFTRSPIGSVFASQVGLARSKYIYGVYTVLLAGNSPDIRSYMVYITAPSNLNHRFSANDV
jgi:hypothetical protein